jgi:hypothetical protein
VFGFHRKPTFTITRYTTPHGGPDEASPLKGDLRLQMP